jgi:uncharacterized RDD family membrane protein YckC
VTEQSPPRVPTHGYGPPAAHFPPPPGYPGYRPPGYPGYGPPPGYPPVPLSPGGQPLASFADRLLAFLVDAAVAAVAALVLMVPVIIVVLVVILPDATEDARLGRDPLQDVIVPVLLIEAALFLVILLLTYLYYVEWVIRHHGQTVGKKVMKLRIVPLDPSATLTRGMAAKRWAATQGCGLVPGLSYLDGLWQLWDKPYQQCLHDKWPKTVVIKVPG